MKTQEIKEMAVKDLRERLEVEKQNLNRMKMNHVISPLENTSNIKKAKTDIARMMRVLAEKEQQN
ncbi:MAG: 50S ribosomal protein L29 [Bacteroidales bacterium]|nr:50S ribosomal protein L29 [Candidatus Cacconaster equifaecalis]MBQ0087286.1 50S ribosomal protein L29 [Candidatus Cacconaster scatequi]MCQ2151452.1 50S ribosomal protein L29 [Bacteroidales bacterium]